MKTKLVKINTKNHVYSYYEGQEKVHEIKSDQPLTKEYVEQFRTNAKSIISEIEDWDGNDPDGDLVA